MLCTIATEGKSNTKRHWYRFYFKTYCFTEMLHYLSAFFGFVDACCAFSTFTTIFCSSIKKARIILSFTHLWQSTPPYALLTVFFRLHMRDLSIDRAGWIPRNLSLHWPHLGIFFGFFKYWYTNLPPGVRTTRLLLLFVLYDKRRL